MIGTLQTRPTEPGESLPDLKVVEGAPAMPACHVLCKDLPAEPEIAEGEHLIVVNSLTSLQTVPMKTFMEPERLVDTTMLACHCKDLSAKSVSANKEHRNVVTSLASLQTVSMKFLKEIELGDISNQGISASEINSVIGKWI